MMEWVIIKMHANLAFTQVSTKTPFIKNTKTKKIRANIILIIKNTKEKRYKIFKSQKHFSLDKLAR